MINIKDNFERVKLWAHRPKIKKRFYVLLILAVLLWVAYRFIMIGIERRMVVFNPARNVSNVGLVVDVMPAQKTNGMLRVPLMVMNNRALVSGERARMLSAGQVVHINNDAAALSDAQPHTYGKIVSVSSSIDLDTGMHVVHTQSVPDGLHSVEYRVSGYLVPAYAVVNDTLFVAEDGVAVLRHVRTGRGDADNVLVTDGLNDGDMIILSRVHNGDRVRINE